MQPATLVLGLGNTLLGDEGVGVRALELLKCRYRLPQGVALVDGGTLGMELLPYLDGASSLLVLDAVLSDDGPGTIVRLEGHELARSSAARASMHQAGLGDVLAAATLAGSLPDKVVVWGIHPLIVDWGAELSPAVSAKLGDLVERVAKELESWGIGISLEAAHANDTA
jgi:hydrogenase maturation protease